jgi:hypothetical protein
MVQLFESFDLEEVVGDNGCQLELHHVNGAVVDFSHEAGKKSSINLEEIFTSIQTPEPIVL